MAACEVCNWTEEEVQTWSKTIDKRGRLGDVVKGFDGQDLKFLTVAAIERTLEKNSHPTALAEGFYSAVQSICNPLNQPSIFNSHVTRMPNPSQFPSNTLSATYHPSNQPTVSGNAYSSNNQYYGQPEAYLYQSTPNQPDSTPFAYPVYNRDPMVASAYPERSGDDEPNNSEETGPVNPFLVPNRDPSAADEPIHFHDSAIPVEDDSDKPLEQPPIITHAEHAKNIEQLSRENYDATEKFRDVDWKGFKAAGIIPVRLSKSSQDVEVLLPIEYREGQRQVHVFGGQRDRFENIRQTATREFSEEINFIVDRDAAAFMLESPTLTKAMWYAKGKYGLYLVHAGDEMSYKQLRDAPTKYSKMRFRPLTAEASALVWVQMKYITNNKSTLKVGKRDIRISSMTKSIFKNSVFAQLMLDLQNSISQKLLKHLLTDEVAKTNKTLAMINSHPMDAFKQFMNLTESTARSPEELINIPDNPPQPLISSLNPSSAEYKAVLSVVPDQFRANITGIRQAGVMSQSRKYNSALIKYSATEKKPVFHGTPDTWRATAIAYHGFDLKIRLHGRACGDGAYSSEQYQMSFGYVGGKGSVLIMKCMTGGTVKISGSPPVFVFPDVDCVLPYAIVDYGPLAADDQYKKILEEAARKREKAISDIKKAVTDFFNSVLERSQRINQDYLKKIQQWSQITENTHLLLPLIRREAYQKERMLPIYLYKDAIVAAMKKYQVTVIGANTGSGKSTQLPQYLLDHVVKPDEKVIVLQPRRINAEKLAERVSFERGTVEGVEVGWRVGHGRGNYCSQSRIVFMTHGLFCELMTHNDTLPGIGAVVLDEAHERSLEVDLGLGQLRNYLAKQATGKNQSNHYPRIIITSATIQEEAERFRKFLVGDYEKEITSKVLEPIPGVTFPVHIEYRPLVTLDSADVGSAGNASVRLSAAIQATLELIDNTKSGNILVFVPGRAEAEKGKQEIEKAAKENAFGDSIDFISFASHETQSAYGTIDQIAHGAQKIINKIVEVFNPNEPGDYNPKPKKPKKTLSVYALSGETNPEEVQNIYHSTTDQTVIFATNVAETGLTLPKINYVVDIGQSRDAQWCNKFAMSILSSHAISKSAARQRAGRAGREAAGYCLRLYSEEEFDKMDNCTRPAIGKACIERTIMTLYELAQRSGNNFTPQSFPLLDPIAPELWRETVQRLVMVDLLELKNPAAPATPSPQPSPKPSPDRNQTAQAKSLPFDDSKYQISEMGKQVNKIGLPIRFARFLLACCKFKCGESGAKIIALLLNDRALITARVDVSEWQSDQGDHCTLLNMYNDYLKEKNSGDGNAERWARYQHLNVQLLREIDHNLYFILETMKSNKLPPIDSVRGKELEEAIEEALCVSFFDQACALTNPTGKLAQKLVRILPPEESKAWFEIQNRVTQGAPPNENQPKEAMVNVHSKAPARNVKLGKSKEECLALFTSIVQTDKQAAPTVYGVAVVRKSVFVRQSAKWCEKVDFQRLYDTYSARRKFSISVTKEQVKIWKKNNAKLWKQLANGFPTAVFAVDDFPSSDWREIRITARIVDASLIEAKIGDIHRKHHPTRELFLNLTGDTKMLKTFFNSPDYRNYRDNISNAWKDQFGTKDKSKLIVLKPHTDVNPPQLEISCRDSAKSVLSAVCGQTQGFLQKHGIQSQIGGLLAPPKVKIDPNDPTYKVQLRLAEICNPDKTIQCSNRNQSMSAIAQYLLRNNCAVYGGFLRDWIINEKTPKDVDSCMVSGTFQQLKPKLDEFAGKNQARLQCANPFQIKNDATHKIYGNCYKLQFQFPGWVVEVDLVEVTNPAEKPTTCDSDVNNLQLCLENGIIKLTQKVPASYSMDQSYQNVLNKQFNFLWPWSDPSYAAKRVAKLLEKGYACISGIPDVQKRHINQAYHHLIKC